MKNTKDTKPAFPALRGLMAVHGLTQIEMGKLIGTTYQTFSKKINNRKDFTFNEIWVIWSYFAEKGENITIDALFFNWLLTIENEDTVSQRVIVIPERRQSR